MPLPLEDDERTCHCPLPAGRWGKDGWHWFRATERWLLAQGHPPEHARSCAGLASAYERCPAYERARREGEDARRALRLVKELRKPEEDYE